MSSIMTCHKRASLLVMLALSGLISLPAQADLVTPPASVTINFSAVLNPGTCTFSLDKSTLALDSTHLTQLTPATLQAAQPVTLTVQDCSGTDASLTPVVNVSGDGITRDTRWLFRSSDSTASNVGIMLVKTNAPPSYSSTEVKNGDDIPLAGMGVNPLDQNIMFYAGISCGGAECVSTPPTPGSLTARILFDLAYR
ncbi:hypothetical protein Z042_04320 [Chania multitudinisentens RB-25]|uniref:Fimbrial-type adhesion domain-containing protein n=1 Tax=Chania multitudinisentens RB-25 TaxID=1441930 RepID=W0LFZ4_9GAMM|nr:fimbrial protein [Chania multitudinisentens]AHG22651.2 hypothetical protein Z042_04320 [Chania multitudinisentens RB-25]